MFNIDGEIKKMIAKYPDLWEKKRYKPNTILFSKGEIVNQNFYIELGILKAYVVNKDLQKNVLVVLFSDGNSILPYSNYPENMPITFYLKTVEDSIIYSISGDDWEKIREKEPISNELVYYNVARILEKFIIQQAEINAYPNAETRYKKAVEIYPNLCRINNAEVALFFGNDRSTINRGKSSLMKNTVRKICHIQNKIVSFFYKF